MTRAVVVGGTGFIGRYVCAAFGALGYEVTAVARRSAAPAGDVHGHRMDVAGSSVGSVAAALRELRPDVIVNAAGEVWGSDERRLVLSNVTLVERLVAAVSALDWRPRLVHLGSVYEYGEPAPGAARAEPTDAPAVNGYARTKLAGSRIVLAAASAGQIDAAVLRVSNVVGPDAPPDSLPGAMVARLREAARTGQAAVLPLHARSARRDYLDVRDLADAVTALANRQFVGVVDVGSGRVVSVRGLLERLMHISGVPARIVVTERGTHRSSFRHSQWPRVDNTAAREILGWTPRHHLDDSLRALWADGVGTEHVEAT